MAARDSALSPEKCAFYLEFECEGASFTQCHVVTLEQAAWLSPGFYLAEAAVPCQSRALRHTCSPQKGKGAIRAWHLHPPIWFRETLEDKFHGQGKEQ